MSWLRNSKALALAVAVLLVSACTTTPRQLDVDQTLQGQLRRVETWHTQGKLGIRVDGEAHSANFDWHNRSDGFALRLSGPFGQGTTWLRRDGDTVTLESPDTPLQAASTAEQLMMDQLGWQVPVSNLRHWVKGIPAPHQPVTQLVRNEDGTLAELHQQGWHISYSRYDTHNGWALPGKLVAVRGPIKLTMVMKSWELPPPDMIDTHMASLL
jgi:outer membrane lipoprotein LolB